MEKNSLKSVLTRLSINFNESYVRYLDDQHNIFFNKWVCVHCRNCTCTGVWKRVIIYWLITNSGPEVGIRAKLHPNSGPTFGPEFGCAL